MLDKIGGRKVLLGILLVVIGVLVDSFSKNGLSVNLLELLKFIGVGFFLGNGIEHTAKAIEKRKPTTTNKTLEKNMQTVDKRLDAIEQSNIALNKGMDYIVQLATTPAPQPQRKA